MLNRWFGPKAHDFLHVLGMCILAAGLPFNKVLMSIGAIWGVSNLVLEGEYLTYWERLKKNVPALLLILLFCLGIIGLAWSYNLGYGLTDLRKKLPLLALPLALAAKPLGKKDLSIVLGVFVGSVFLITLVNFITYYFYNQGEELSNVRSMSKYVSHIRFSMMVVAATVVSWFFCQQFKTYKWILLALIFWFLTYTYVSQVLTGILALAGVLYGFLVFKSWHKILVRFILLLFPFIAFISGFVLLTSQGRSHMKMPQHLPSHTSWGNPYRHDTTNFMIENGQFVNINICDDELKEEWEKVSNFAYDGFDEQGQLITGTLYRYMTFLGLKKDGEGFKKLDKKAIRNIEKGFANPNSAKSGIMRRLADLQFQLENDHEPNGHSLLQRLEYWKTGSRIITHNFLLGVGPGDVSDAFNKQYIADNSPLIDQYRLRAHNTYLTHWISFGLGGFLLTLWFFYSYLKEMYRKQAWLPFVLSYIFLFSFFIEDTLETQAGVSLFALLISLFIADKPRMSEHNIS